MELQRSSCSLRARHSSEAVNVVSAAGLGVVTALAGRLVASLHVLEHLAALGVAHLVSGATEVGGEEAAEGGDLRGGLSTTWDGLGVGRSEEVRGVDLEALKIRVGKLADGNTSGGLEWMSSHEGGMGVIYAIERLCQLKEERCTYKQGKRTGGTRYGSARISF